MASGSNLAIWLQLICMIETAAVPQSDVQISNLGSKVAGIIVARCTRPVKKTLLVRDVGQIGRAPLVVDRNHSCQTGTARDRRDPPVTLTVNNDKVQLLATASCGTNLRVLASPCIGASVTHDFRPQVALGLDKGTSTSARHRGRAITYAIRSILAILPLCPHCACSSGLPSVCRCPHPRGLVLATSVKLEFSAYPPGRWKGVKFQTTRGGLTKYGYQVARHR
jgi:hypothetical protein